MIRSDIRSRVNRHLISPDMVGICNGTHSLTHGRQFTDFFGGEEGDDAQEIFKSRSITITITITIKITRFTIITISSRIIISVLRDQEIQTRDAIMAMAMDKQSGALGSHGSCLWIDEFVS